MPVQDRFQHIVPTLNKLGNLTVGLTLMLIGVLGIVESRQHNQEVAQQLQPITPEGSVIKGQDICLLKRARPALTHPARFGLTCRCGAYPVVSPRCA